MNFLMSYLTTLSIIGFDKDPLMSNLIRYSPLDKFEVFMLNSLLPSVPLTNTIDNKLNQSSLSLKEYDLLMDRILFFLRKTSLI